MYITVAVLFSVICWVVGLLFFINFSIAAPQYGTKKFKLKYYTLFWLGLIVLFIGLPALSFFLAL